ncbi:MAG: hypothetical protein JWN00_4572 [Actinomycetia bacterium]|nr:hypothetical protein [Actinomycetes bacterium]
MTIRRYAAGAAAGTTLVLSLTACLGTTGTGASGGGSNASLTAAEVIQNASQKTSSFNTFKAEITTTGLAEMHGLVQFQLKPTVAMSMNIDKMGAAGQSMPGGMQAVLLGDVMYVKMPQLSSLAGGKPWIKISLQQVGSKSGLNIDALLKQAQQNSPADQTKFLTASKDVHKVGTEDINGVSTTHYAGTVSAADAMAKLDTVTQGKFKDLYTKAGISKIAFDVWVDGNSLPQKMESKVNTAQGAVDTTLVYSDYGKPVNIAAPPASEVGTFSGLGG